MASACDKVFGAVELLDIILCNIIPSGGPPALRQVYCLQGVNKTFYYHIRGGTKVAQELHLTPKPATAKESLIATCIGSKIFKSGQKIFSWANLGPNFRHKDKALLEFIVEGKTVQLDLQSRKDLLVIQPPIKQIEVQIWVSIPFESYCKPLGEPRTLKREKGITVGSMVKAAKTMLEENGAPKGRSHAAFKTYIPVRVPETTVR